MVRVRRLRWTGGPAVLLAVALLVGGCGGSDGRAGPSRTTTTTAGAATTSSVPATTTTTAASLPGTTVPAPVAYVAMYPFADLREAAAWQQSYREGGGPAWYLGAGATALAFAHFLGYTTVDRVVGSTEDAKGAHVSIGYQVPQTTRTATAAIVHLVRYGSGNDVPWEVVGTDDTDFSLDVPGYGATVASPLRVGGSISGVDENIRVVVQQLHSNGSLGQFCCVPAGGVHSPWSATVTFARPTDAVVMIAASTGGHVTQVERFTVTGAHV